jgi:hypothetical protein
MANAGNSNSAQALRRYIALLMGALGIALALVLTLNLVLGDRGLGDLETTRTASAWQQATRGITYAPPVGGTRPFKVLRLADRLPEINALVLGSSSLMGITQGMLPAELRLYNLTVTGNSTASIAGEALYIERHLAERVRWVLVGLDWSAGMIYLPGNATDMDLSAESVARAYIDNPVPLSKRLEDALSWPRVANLGTLFKRRCAAASRGRACGMLSSISAAPSTLVRMVHLRATSTLSIAACAAAIAMTAAGLSPTTSGLPPRLRRPMQWRQ